MNVVEGLLEAYYGTENGKINKHKFQKENSSNIYVEMAMKQQTFIHIRDHPSESTTKIRTLCYTQVSQL